MRDINVLVSAAGRRVALLRIFRRTLAAMGLRGRVLAADASPLSAAFHDADAGFLVPRCTHDEFVPAVLELCRANDVRLVVPTIDTELPVYARHRERFAAAGVTVLVSSPEAIDVGADKVRTHAWLVENGLPTVRQASVAEVRARPHEWPFPLVVKPRAGSASIGVAVVHDARQLEVAARGEVVVQTVAPGIEHTVDALVDAAGRCRCAVPRRRLEVRAGEVSKAVTVRSATIEELAVRTCEALPGARGVLTLQVFLDEPTGRLSVIELNPRFGGGFPLTWEAGGDYPRWIVEELLGLPCGAAADRWRDGLVMLRWDDAVFVDAGAAGLR